jgi:hypothetical protein
MNMERQRNAAKQFTSLLPGCLLEQLSQWEARRVPELQAERITARLRDTALYGLDVSKFLLMPQTTFQRMQVHGE